jgi:hypothetical protein
VAWGGGGLGEGVIHRGGKGSMGSGCHREGAVRVG